MLSQLSWGIGRSEAEGWGMGHWALGEAKRRDGAWGMGHWAKRSGGMGHWALGIGHGA